MKQIEHDPNALDDRGRWSSSADLAAAMAFEKAISGKVSGEKIAMINGRHQLDADLENFSDPRPVYSLTDDQRDRLIAHARQDAAHAVSISIILNQRIELIAQRITIFGAIIVTFLALITWNLWR
ncbi:hypothetical protein FHS55_002627 [Angulomicrobium tetraedrale]|uniref:Uncharacterized protein n=1 Tax=Ancylobacter tetraedralis TaxID=217068 RepID=A0A839ZBE6_9HYPH|nr:hypothetical protein [Ancylobacter tetraedralis]MBB3772018.1 hypothetical protein [Ancylobacter tetraedralis]